MKISRLHINGVDAGLVTDDTPRIGFELESSIPGESLRSAIVRVGDWETTTTEQIGILCPRPLAPHTEYTVTVTATGTSGARAEASTTFRTGRLQTPWTAKWITDRTYRAPQGQSPVPMEFRKRFAVRADVKRAWIESTSLGIYDLSLNGVKLGDEYFAPGFTSYHHHLQYQTHDVTRALQDNNELIAVVAGGWAVGSYTHKRKNRIYADRQALLGELRIEYLDGTTETISTGSDWEVSTSSRFRMAEWYDGETYDAALELDPARWKRADVTRPRGRPDIRAQYGPAVRVQKELQPVSHSLSPSGEIVYDFGQNFAGVIRARVRGRKGQEVIFRHAEVLVENELFVASLRTAKATATYICADGEQEYSPRFTYMGFRFVGVRGIDPEDLELFALVLHSDVPQVGEFECSNELINGLQHAIEWGGRSNFVDIPTDCPQRDEREGWTGDFAVFASTASFNFDMSRFIGKWMRDVTAEQGRGGGIPMVVPKAGNPFPTMATSCWGDACILVPWAEYLARGDRELLRAHYGTMKRFLKAAKWWSVFGSLTRHGRRIWRWPFHFGDWTSPDGSAKEWIQKGKWIGTAYFANSCAIVSQIAELLGHSDDASRYRKLRDEIVDAYRAKFTDGTGTLHNEFQTAYVLPLHFGMTDGSETQQMVDNLSRLIRDAGGHLRTGFPGTPYILFALSDHGRASEAFDLLLQTAPPSWLYMIKAGGTTIWERWDALRPDGTVNIADLTGGSDEDSSGGMVSFNHYAAGAVGDWLYRRVAGIEAVEAGYRAFTVAPLVGGGLTSATARVRTPYGAASSSWSRDGTTFGLRVEVPVSTSARVTMPDGVEHHVLSGTHEFSCELSATTARTH